MSMSQLMCNIRRVSQFAAASAAMCAAGLVVAAPTISLITATPQTTAGSTGNLFLQAQATGGPGSTGLPTVKFYNGGTYIADGNWMLAGGIWSYLWTGISPGTYNISATVTNNLAETAGTTSQPIQLVVNQPPEISLTTDHPTYAAPATVQLVATVSDSDGTIQQVKFYKKNGMFGQTQVGTATTAPYSVTLSSVAAGDYVYSAVVYDNYSVGTTSNPVSVAVTNGGNAAPTISLSSPSSGATDTAPGSFTVTASAADSDGTVTQVKFYDGPTLINTLTSAPYTFTWSNVAAGNHVVTATVYDNSGAAATTTPIVVTVSP